MDEDDREADGEEERIGALDLALSSARVLASSFIPFAILTVLVTAPARVADVALAEWAYRGGALTDGYLGVSLGNRALTLVLACLAQAALTHATVEHMAGRRPRVTSSLATVLRHAGPVLVIAFLEPLVIWLGLLACVVPGVVLACVLFVAVPAAIVERRGPLEAMQRSADLTRGHRLTIFFVLLITVAAGAAATYGLSAGLASLPPAGIATRMIVYAASALLGTLVMMFQAVLAAVCYARVRRIHDGLDVDTIAKVFE